jgi:uncharacterized membrane protein
VLVLLRVIDADTPLADDASKVALEALPLSIGASVANTQFDPGRREQETRGRSPAVATRTCATPGSRSPGRSSSPPTSPRPKKSP